MKSEPFFFFFSTGSQSDCWHFVHAWVLIEREVDLQKVQAGRGNLSRRAVPADPQYRAGQPNPEDLKDQVDPDRREDARVSCPECRFIQLLPLISFFFKSVLDYFFFPVITATAVQIQ